MQRWGERTEDSHTLQALIAADLTEHAVDQVHKKRKKKMAKKMAKKMDNKCRTMVEALQRCCKAAARWCFIGWKECLRSSIEAIDWYLNTRYCQ
jgi:hypothetical protein